MGFFEFLQITAIKIHMSKAPKTKKNANNDTATPIPGQVPGMNYRYKRAYELLLKQESEQMQARILGAKTNPDKHDKDVDAFVKLVAELAESDKEL